MNRRVLIDTGPLVALRNTRDQHRDKILKFAQQLPAPLYTCWPVLTEAAYLLRKHPQEVEVLLDSLRAGTLVLLPLDETDTAGISGILHKYVDQALSLADASLMHLAEREGINEVFTVDSKDFSVFRKSNGGVLSILGE